MKIPGVTRIFFDVIFYNQTIDISSERIEKSAQEPLEEK